MVPAADTRFPLPAEGRFSRELAGAGELTGFAVEVAPFARSMS